MIKGINKQIIEIRCTDDEYFDKVLLFVRADKSGSSSSLLRRKAINLCERFLRHSIDGRADKKAIRILKIVLIVSLAVVAVTAAYLSCVS